jgi:hypothetical protein
MDAQGQYSVSLGYLSSAGGTSSVAIGDSATATTEASIALGTQVGMVAGATGSAMTYGIVLGANRTGVSVTNNTTTLPVGATLAPRSATGGFMVFPVRELSTLSPSRHLYLVYDIVTFEVFCSAVGPA